MQKIFQVAGYDFSAFVEQCGNGEYTGSVWEMCGSEYLTDNLADSFQTYRTRRDAMDAMEEIADGYVQG